MSILRILCVEIGCHGSLFQLEGFTIVFLEKCTEQPRKCAGKRAILTVMQSPKQKLPESCGLFSSRVIFCPV